VAVVPVHPGLEELHRLEAGQAPDRFVHLAGRGPPVRPLDRFYTKVAKGRVLLGPRYSVNRELRRFSPRDPGEPLDGLGQYAYPSRPSIRKLPGT